MLNRRKTCINSSKLSRRCFVCISLRIIPSKENRFQWIWFRTSFSAFFFGHFLFFFFHWFLEACLKFCSLLYANFEMKDEKYKTMTSLCWWCRFTWIRCHNWHVSMATKINNYHQTTRESLCPLSQPRVIPNKNKKPKFSVIFSTLSQYASAVEGWELALVVFGKGVNRALDGYLFLTENKHHATGSSKWTTEVTH